MSERNDIEKMDRIFRQMNFAADNPGLEERLWSRIVKRIKDEEAEADVDDRPLTDSELSLLAAGSDEQRAERIREILASIDVNSL